MSEQWRSWPSQAWATTSVSVSVSVSLNSRPKPNTWDRNRDQTTRDGHQASRPNILDIPSLVYRREPNIQMTKGKENKQKAAERENFDIC